MLRGDRTFFPGAVFIRYSLDSLQFTDVSFKPLSVPVEFGETIEAIVSELGRLGLAACDDVFVCVHQDDNSRVYRLEPVAKICGHCHKPHWLDDVKIDGQCARRAPRVHAKRGTLSRPQSPKGVP